MQARPRGRGQPAPRAAPRGPGAPAAEMAAMRLGEEEARAQAHAALRADVESTLRHVVPSRDECRSCCQPFRSGETALLPCCHTICRACVRQQNGEGFACPSCFTAVPAGATLPQNPFIEDGLAVTRPCLQCHKDGIDGDATYECTTAGCNAALCDDHKNLHLRAPATRDHTVALLAPHATADVCATHRQPYTAYCVSCRVLACLACTVPGGPHVQPRHSIAMLGNHAYELQNAIHQAQQTASQRQNELVDQLATLRPLSEAIASRSDRLAADIESIFATLERALRARKEALLHEVRSLANEEDNTVRGRTDNDSLRWLTLQGGLDMAERLLAPTTAPVRLGQLTRIVTDHLTAAAEARVAGTPAVAEVAIYVDRTVDDVLRSVGKLQFLRAQSSSCTVDGGAVARAVSGRPASFLVTVFSRSKDRVRRGGCTVLARLVPEGAEPDNDHVLRDLVDNGDGTYRCSYTATTTGIYHLDVVVDREYIPGCPFSVTVAPAKFVYGQSWADANAETPPAYYGNVFAGYGGGPDLAQYDQDGLIDFLSTVGGTQPRQNLHDAGKMVVAVSEGMPGSLSRFLDTSGGGGLQPNPQAESTITVFLGGWSIRPTGYTLGWNFGENVNRNLKQPPTNWIFEGSLDGSTWTTIDQQNSYNLQNGAKYWPLSRQMNGMVMSAPHGDLKDRGGDRVGVATFSWFRFKFNVVNPNQRGFGRAAYPAAFPQNPQQAIEPGLYGFDVFGELTNS